MGDRFLINIDKLKNYQSNFKGEYTNFTNGSRKSFSNSYFYQSSDSTVVTMRNKLNTLYTEIDKGYSNIIKWMGDYIKDSDDLEKSLKTATAKVSDTSTNSALKKIEGKNNVKINESTDIVYKIKKNRDTGSSGAGFSDIVKNYNDKFIMPLAETYGEYKEDFLKLYEEIGQNSAYREELKKEVDDLKKEFDDYLNYTKGDYVSKVTLSISNPTLAAAKLAEDDNNPEFKELEKLENAYRSGALTSDQIASLTARQKKYLLLIEKQMQLANLDEEAINLKYEMDMLKYKKMETTSQYKYYFKYYSTDQRYNTLMASGSEYANHTTDYDWTVMYDYNKNHGIEIKEEDFPNKLKIGDVEAEIDYKTFYEYTTYEQRMMYHYLFETQGPDKANEYVTLLLTKINQQVGMAKAKKNIDEANYYYSGYADEDWRYKALSFVASFWKTTERCVVNNLGQFCDDYESLAVTKKIKTSDEWARYYEANYFNEIGFGYYYDVLGNVTRMAPTMLIGAMSSPVVGSAMFTASIWGGAHNEAIRSGMSESKAFWYATLIASEEFATDLFFKATPGLSKMNWEQTALKRCTKEILGEGLQTFYENGVDCILNGKEWDIGEVSDEAFYSMLVAAGSFCITNGTHDIKNMNDFIITYKKNGQEHQIKGIKGLEFALKENNIIPSNVDFDKITSFDRNLAIADAYAKDGRISEIKVDDINDVTPEKLSKIDNKDLVMFKLPDGRILSYSEMQNEISNTKTQNVTDPESKAISDAIDSLPTTSSQTGITSEQKANGAIKVETKQDTAIKDTKIAEETKSQEQKVAVGQAFQESAKQVKEVLDKTQTITKEQATDTVTNTFEAVQNNLSNNNQTRTPTKNKMVSGFLNVANIIINSNKGSISLKNLLGGKKDSNNYELDTKGLSKSSKETAKSWKIDKQVGQDIHELISDDNYVYGVHRTGSLASAESIYESGLRMSGDISSGVDQQSIPDISSNVTVMENDTTSKSQKEYNIFQEIISSSSYKVYGSKENCGLIIRIPKDCVFYDSNGKIVGYDYSKLYYKEGNTYYLKPGYVAGEIKVVNGEIVSSNDTKIKSESPEIENKKFFDSYSSNYNEKMQILRSMIQQLGMSSSESWYTSLGLNEVNSNIRIYYETAVMRTIKYYETAENISEEFRKEKIESLIKKLENPKPLTKEEINSAMNEYESTYGEKIIELNAIKSRIEYFLKNMYYSEEQISQYLSGVNINNMNTILNNLEKEYTEGKLLPNYNHDYYELQDIKEMLKTDINKAFKILEESGFSSNDIERYINYLNQGKFDYVAERIFIAQNNILIKSSVYFQYVDGIKFVSDSEEGLAKLINYYQESKTSSLYVDGISISNDQMISFYDDLSNLAKSSRGLVITNMTLVASGDYFFKNSNNTNMPYIRISSETIDNSDYTALYHEGGHYKGMTRDSNYEVFDPIGSIIGNTKPAELEEIVEKYRMYQEEYRNNLIERIRNDYSTQMEQELEQRLTKELGEDYKTNPSKASLAETLENIYRQEILEDYIELYQREEGLAALDDIFEALGFKVGRYGHGREYYSKQNNSNEEIRANLNQIFFSGNFGIIGKFFNETVVKELREGVEKINGIDNTSPSTSTESIDSNDTNSNNTVISNKELINKYHNEALTYIELTYQKHPEYGTLNQEKINLIFKKAGEGNFDGISREYREKFISIYQQEVTLVGKENVVNEKVAKYLIANPGISVEDALEYIQTTDTDYLESDGGIKYPPNNGAKGVENNYIALTIENIIRDALGGKEIDFNSATLAELNKELAGTGIQFKKSDYKNQLSLVITEDVLKNLNIKGVTIRKLNHGEVLTRVGKITGNYIGTFDNSLSSISLPRKDKTELFIGEFTGDSDDNIYIWEEEIGPWFGELGGGIQRYILVPDENGNYAFRTRKIIIGSDEEFDSKVFTEEGWTVLCTSYKNLRDGVYYSTGSKQYVKELMHVNIAESDINRLESYKDYYERMSQTGGN